jgi:hypothetical protein
MIRDTADMFKDPDRGRFGENEERQARPGRGPRVTGASDLKDFTATLRFETRDAIQITHSSEPNRKIWLPKSQIEFVRKSGATIEVTLPEWLAIDKGLA